MDTFGKKVLSGSVWVWDPVGIFLYVPRSLLDQVLVCLLAPGFIAMALYSHQGPYFCQIRSDFSLCLGLIPWFSAWSNPPKYQTKNWPARLVSTTLRITITWTKKSLKYKPDAGEIFHKWCNESPQSSLQKDFKRYHYNMYFYSGPAAVSNLPLL